MLVTLKIRDNDQRVNDLHVDTDKMHESWIEKCLAYGIKRFPNDSYSGEKGDTKLELVRALLKDMQSGQPAPVRIQGAGRAPSDPIGSLASKNAKADLTGMFRAITGFTKAIDFATHEKVAPFFTITEDKAVWNESTVKAWMGKQAESGKRDYMADAKATIESVTEASDDLEF